MDELKKYLQQNRASLDVDEPSPMLWERIQVEQPVKRTSVIMMATRWVAAACVLVLAGIGTWSLLNKNDQPIQQPIAEVTQQPTSTNEPSAEETLKPEKTTEPILAKSADKVDKKSTQPKTTIAQRADLVALNNVENSFKQVINLQRNRVGSIPMFAETADYFADFKIQIRQLEQDEKKIKADIVKRGLTDELLNQIINIYQIKLSTLKQLQIEMNKINNRYKQNRGPVDSVKTYFINI